MGKELCGCNKKEIDTQKILEQNVFNYIITLYFFSQAIHKKSFQKINIKLKKV